MVKNDPQRKSMIFFVVLMSIMALYAMAYTLYGYFSKPPAQRSSLLLVLVAIGGLLLISLIVSLFISLKLLDNRRTLAMQGSPQMLAVNQPVRDAYALALPTTIELRPNTRFYFLLFIMLSVVVFLPLALITIFSHGSNPIVLLKLLVILAGFLVALLLALSVMFLFLRKLLLYRVHVTEQGISASYNGFTTSLNWDAARVFTVNGIRGANWTKSYELSNNETVVRWMCIPCHAQVMIFLRPTISCDEYNRQMQGLLELIEAKTHLPLYDITPKIWWRA